MHDAWPKRLYALDVSRSMASLAVVLWHWQHFAFSGTARPVGFDRSIQPFYGLLRIFYDEGSRGVDYFFILSGFIFFWLYRKPIADRAMTLGGFWLQRFSRFYPMHLAALVLVALLQGLYFLKRSTFFVYPFGRASPSPPNRISPLKNLIPTT
jgi:peptidoglycan/LPS O-acetylase OafA/YrhL